MFGISTCYWTEDIKDLKHKDIIWEITNMGFEAIELEYRIPENWFKSIKLLIKRKLKVLSIHNYFPKPNEPYIKGSGDLFLLSSTDKDEHNRAIKYTMKTIEYANDMEALAVVLHLGRVEMQNPFNKLKQLFQEAKINQKVGKKFIEKQKNIRDSLKQRHIDSVLKALDRLLPYAEKYGITLGIENRFYFHEIPNIEEIELILKEFKGGNIGYWHDIGHAVIQEKLGICFQKDLLRSFSNDIIGIHIHDVKDLEDHLAPREGELNFKDIFDDIKKDVIKILEVHKKAKKDFVIKAKNMFLHN